MRWLGVGAAVLVSAPACCSQWCRRSAAAGARPSVRRGGARDRGRGAGGQPDAAATARDCLRHLPRRGGGNPRLRGPEVLRINNSPASILDAGEPPRCALHPPPARACCSTSWASADAACWCWARGLHALAPRAAQSLRLCRYRPAVKEIAERDFPARAGARRVRRRRRARPPARNRRAPRRGGGRRSQRAHQHPRPPGHARVLARHP